MSAKSPRDSKNMSFFGHLEELRKRLFWCAAAVIIGGSLFFYYTTEIVDTVYIAMSKTDFVTYRWLCQFSQTFHLGDSLCAAEIPIRLQSVKVTGQFSTNIYFAAVGGIVAAFPFLLFQVWSFIKPGLKKNELRATRGVVFYASLLFALGIFFGYFLIAPLCIQFFGTYTMSSAVDNDFTISDYISTITTTTFWTGVLFELPILIYILSKLDVVNPAFLRTYRKHAIVVVLILAAIITPPDFYTQVLVAIPILILYEISIFVSARVHRQRKPS